MFSESPSCATLLSKETDVTGYQTIWTPSPRASDTVIVQVLNNSTRGAQLVTNFILNNYTVIVFVPYVGILASLGEAFIKYGVLNDKNSIKSKLRIISDTPHQRRCTRKYLTGLIQAEKVSNVYMVYDKSYIYSPHRDATRLTTHSIACYISMLEALRNTSTVTANLVQANHREGRLGRFYRQSKYFYENLGDVIMKSLDMYLETYHRLHAIKFNKCMY